MGDLVECYSGAEYAEQPRKFFWQGNWRTVSRIRSEHRTPGGKQFEVEDEEQGRFLLTYDSGPDLWTIQPAP